MIAPSAAPKRSRTVTLSITVDEDDLELLKRRARRVSGGNVSAAVLDALRIAREIEGHDELSAWLLEGREAPSPETMSEWLHRNRRRWRQRRVA
jgi:hypothetical protein